MNYIQFCKATLFFEISGTFPCRRHEMLVAIRLTLYLSAVGTQYSNMIK